MKMFNWKPLERFLTKEIHPRELSELLETRIEKNSVMLGIQSGDPLFYNLKKLAKVLRKCQKE